MSYDTDVVRIMWYETIAGGMSGILIPPPNSSIITELWKDNNSVLTSTFSNGIPNFETPLTTGGTLVEATLDADGNYVLLNEPASYPIALIYIYEVEHKDFDKTLALFGRIYQDNLGLHSPYKTESETFAIGAEYTEPEEDNEAAPKKYIDDKVYPADQIEIAEIGIATYDDVQDWLNNVQSSGKFDGGVLSDGGSGSVAYSAIKGMIKTSDSVLGITKSYDLAGGTLTAGESSPNIVEGMNYIYVDCVSGTTPTVKATDDRDNIKWTWHHTLGRVWREGETVDILTSGLSLYNFPRRAHERLIARSLMEHMSGNALSATGLTIAATAGEFYVGLNSIATAEKLAATDFEHYYYRASPSGWTDADPAVNAIDSDYYDDGTGTLHELVANRYSVHWVYICFTGDLSIVYGRGNYTLAQANTAQPPGDLPDYLNRFATLCGKVIVQKGAADLTSLESAWEVQFSPTAVQNHNDLSNLQGGTTDQYYHLLLIEYTELSEWLDNVTLGNDGLTSIPELVLTPRAAALSDAKGGMYFSTVDDSVYVCTSTA